MSTALSDWRGCYDESWKGTIADEAFAHPAKFAPGLIRRILVHGIQQNYWAKNDLVGDPFGGVGCGGIMAAYAGLRHVSVELEPRFVALAEQNFDLHRTRWEQHGFPVPRIVQGDSRRFAEVVGAVECVITSPPYANSMESGDKSSHIDFSKCADGREWKDSIGNQGSRSESYGFTDGQIGSLKSGSLDAVITSPPYAETALSGGPTADGQGYTAGARCLDDYGASPGQIGALKAGAVDAIVNKHLPETTASAKYSDYEQRPTSSEHQKRSQCRETVAIKGIGNPLALSRTGLVTAENRGIFSGDSAIDSEGDGATRDYFKIQGAARGEPSPLQGREIFSSLSDDDRKRQVLNLQEHGELGDSSSQWGSLRQSSWQPSDSLQSMPQQGTQAPLVDNEEGHGTFKALSGAPPEDYWQAMRAVYAQCALALKPGGVMAVVVKNYVAKGKIVPLCDQTLALLEHLGFTPLERIRAMLVDEWHESDLFTGHGKGKRERKSFFRRLYESRPGSHRIDFEEVLIVRSPA